MRHHYYPEVGKWYKNMEYNSIFEVVARDESDEYVEIQYFAGEIEEVDLETWFQLVLKKIPAPEDFTGIYELSKEDLGYSDETIHPENWTGPLTQIEPENPSTE